MFVLEVESASFTRGNVKHPSDILVASYQMQGRFIGYARIYLLVDCSIPVLHGISISS